jgi:hypothetical protein
MPEPRHAGVSASPALPGPPLRNDIPETGYRWKDRTYPWAKRRIAAAEAAHGPPSPTCRCGRPAVNTRDRPGDWTCGKPSCPHHRAKGLL